MFMKILPSLVLATACLFATSALQAQRPGKSKDMRISTNLKVGDTAPDFRLKMNDGSREVQLSSFRGKRPVVLVFGSYT